MKFHIGRQEYRIRFAWRPVELWGQDKKRPRYVTNLRKYIWLSLVIEMKTLALGNDGWVAYIHQQDLSELIQEKTKI